MVCFHVLKREKITQIWMIAVLKKWRPILLLCFQNFMRQCTVTMVDYETFKKNPTRLGVLVEKSKYDVKTNGISKLAPICPYKSLVVSCLPFNQQNILLSTWHRIFEMMKGCQELEIPKSIDDLGSKYK